MEPGIFSADGVRFSRRYLAGARRDRAPRDDEFRDACARELSALAQLPPQDRGRKRRRPRS